MMNSKEPIVISISRQKGCGGAYLGQKIANDLGMAYLDRALVAEIAKKVDEPIEFVEAYDEKIVPIWQRMVEVLGPSNPWAYCPPPAHIPAVQISELEANVIKTIAGEKSVVIVGRASSWVLRNHPHHVSIFLFASLQSRIERTQHVYNISTHDARKLVEKADQERERYVKSLSGLSMSDATQYNFSIDTNSIGLSQTEQLILEYVKARYPFIDGT